jgi:excinuclease ABC subunit A
MTVATAHPTYEIAADLICVRGARVHNLRGVDVDIPRGRFVVLTGVSGSGKSSLAFDTLFAEGRRRYLESVSTYTRQFVEQLERPDVDLLEGLPPTLSIEQRAGSHQSRSTVATLTEVYDYLRVLYARAGVPHCPDCGHAIAQQSPQAIVDQILALEQGRKVMLLAPMVRGRKGAQLELFEKIGREGFVRARVDGEIVDVADPPKLAKSKPHDIDAIIDRIIVKPGIEARLHESVALALKHGDGACIVSHDDNGQWTDRLYSSRFACPACGQSLAEIEPRTFIFNSPYGACPECEGLGVIESSGKEPTTSVCPECHGARLGPVGRAVTIADRSLPQLVALPVGQAVEVIDAWQSSARPDAGDAVFSAAGKLVAEKTLRDVGGRLHYLRQVGLDYLTLDRAAQTLSGGEFQRTRLAGALGSGLIGVCYILDEPTIGLHPRDSDRLVRVLQSLRDQGNSVLVVEHDLETIRQADYLVDLGPGAGSEGGQLVAAGALAEVAADADSLTGGFLSGRLSVVPPRPPRALETHPRLGLANVSTHNLQNVSVEIPLEAFVCVTGVSGSGKSSLIIDTLLPALRDAMAGRTAAMQLQGVEHVQRLVEVDQSPLGRTARSNPATYSGLWDIVRKVFAQTREARARGYSPRRFSFNAAEGRCAACQGQGTRRIEMNFLPDVQVVCPECHGARFNPATLEIHFRGKSIADVLDMRIDEAAEFFESFSKLRNSLDVFVEVGLGYLALGQSALTLSGGEAQRVKLATELCKSQQRGTLFLLDEPTTGLHPADVRNLLAILDRLVSQGNTVLVIEHQVEVIAAADWVIDLGPEGGAGGGRIVAEGPPERIAGVAESHTGAALRSLKGEV